MTGGLVPLIALGLWVPIGLSFFALMHPRRALVLCVVGGMLMLPEQTAFDAPLIPAIGKNEIAALTALLGCAIFAPRTLLRRPASRMDWLLLLVLLGVVPTVLANPEPLVNGIVFRPGLTTHDIVSGFVSTFLAIGLPFMLGRWASTDLGGLRIALSAIVTCAVLYSGFIWIELRFSPQFHNWVYGFHPQGFDQSFRWGGYRPFVFTAHGLALSSFILVAMISSLGLKAVRQRVSGWSPGTLALYLGVVLLMCRSTGAIIMGAVVLLLIGFLRSALQARVATVLVAVCLAFPLMRITGTAPDEVLVGMAAGLQKDRASSLDYRFTNEKMLTERAVEKLWTGWGGFGRGRVFDAEGRDLSVTDGYWIIVFGERGLIGLYGCFALLVFPVLLVPSALARTLDAGEKRLLACSALLVTVQVIDLLPNGLFSPFPYFCSGMLLSAVRSVGLSRPPEV
jgi:hypothetical protein